MRLYVDHHTVDADTLYLLLGLANQTALDLCLGLHHGGPGTSARNGMLWRLLPILDPLVDVVLVRDLDSRLSRREAEAVEEWLASSKAVHVMRDHPSHSWPMLGGMWGARMDLGHRELFSNLTKLFIDDVSSPPPRLRTFLLIFTLGSSHWVVQGSGPGGASKMGLATGRQVIFITLTFSQTAN